jgi:hypothetical protein
MAFEGGVRQTPTSNQPSSSSTNTGQKYNVQPIDYTQQSFGATASYLGFPEGTKVYAPEVAPKGTTLTTTATGQRVAISEPPQFTGAIGEQRPSTGLRWTEPKPPVLLLSKGVMERYGEGLSKPIVETRESITETRYIQTTPDALMTPWKTSPSEEAKGSDIITRSVNVWGKERRMAGTKLILEGEKEGNILKKMLGGAETTAGSLGLMLTAPKEFFIKPTVETAKAPSLIGTSLMTDPVSSAEFGIGIPLLLAPSLFKLPKYTSFRDTAIMGEVAAPKPSPSIFAKTVSRVSTIFPAPKTKTTVTVSRTSTIFKPISSTREILATEQKTIMQGKLGVEIEGFEKTFRYSGDITSTAARPREVTVRQARNVLSSSTSGQINVYDVFRTKEGGLYTPVKPLSRTTISTDMGLVGYGKKSARVVLGEAKSFTDIEKTAGFQSYIKPSIAEAKVLRTNSILYSGEKTKQTYGIVTREITTEEGFKGVSSIFIKEKKKPVLKGFSVTDLKEEFYTQKKIPRVEIIEKNALQKFPKGYQFGVKQLEDKVTPIVNADFRMLTPRYKGLGVYMGKTISGIKPIEKMKLSRTYKPSPISKGIYAIEGMGESKIIKSKRATFRSPELIIIQKVRQDQRLNKPSTADLSFGKQVISDIGKSLGKEVRVAKLESQFDRSLGKTLSRFKPIVNLASYSAGKNIIKQSSYLRAGTYQVKSPLTKISKVTTTQYNQQIFKVYPIQSIIPALKTSTLTQQKPISKTITSYQPSGIFDMPSFDTQITVPKGIGLPVGALPFGGGWSSSSSGKRRKGLKFKSAYKPSVEAILLNVRGKKSVMAEMTGLDIRNIIR